MASQKFTGAQAATAVIPENMLLKSILLTAAAADATATLIGNGINEVIIAAKAGTSVEYSATSGGNQFSLEVIPGPVTITITGAGAFVRLSY